MREPGLRGDELESFASPSHIANSVSIDPTDKLSEKRRDNTPDYERKSTLLPSAQIPSPSFAKYGDVTRFVAFTPRQIASVVLESIGECSSMFCSSHAVG